MITRDISRSIHDALTECAEINRSIQSRDNSTRIASAVDKVSDKLREALRLVENIDDAERRYR